MSSVTDGKGAAAAQYDLVIKGGEVLDPSQGLRGKHDLAVTDGRIVAVEPEIPLSRVSSDDRCEVIDATGQLVVPGLIDLHTHLGFEVHRRVVRAEDVCPASGVTAAVDMGSTGAFTFPWYRNRVLERCPVRLYEFINISSIGTIAIHNPYYVDYYCDGVYLDVDDTARTIDENHDFIRGIKVFGTSRMAGEWVMPAMRAARQVADRVDVPIAVHVSAEPPPLEDILDLLKPGDIITHSYTSLDQGILDANGKLRDSVIEARERGIFFDLGHGAGSFSFDVARKALDQGFPPDAVSTDIYYANTAGPVKDMSTTMAKFLALGYSLEELLPLVTTNPAQVLARDGAHGNEMLGTLDIGAPADIALIRVKEGEFPLVDSRKNVVQGQWMPECSVAICGGQVIYRRE